MHEQCIAMQTVTSGLSHAMHNLPRAIIMLVATTFIAYRDVVLHVLDLRLRTRNLMLGYVYVYVEKILYSTRV